MPVRIEKKKKGKRTCKGGRMDTDDMKRAKLEVNAIIYLENLITNHISKVVDGMNLSLDNRKYFIDYYKRFEEYLIKYKKILQTYIYTDKEKSYFTNKLVQLQNIQQKAFELYKKNLNNN